MIQPPLPITQTSSNEYQRTLYNPQATSPVPAGKPLLTRPAPPARTHRDSLDILHLLAHLLDQDLHLHGQLSQLDIR